MMILDWLFPVPQIAPAWVRWVIRVLLLVAYVLMLSGHMALGWLAAGMLFAFLLAWGTWYWSCH